MTPRFLTRLLSRGLTLCALGWLMVFRLGAEPAPAITAEFDNANRLLAAGKAGEAIRAYERLTQQAGTSSAIERNWAQACQLAGLNAHALLHLRRAAHLSPRDADVASDLKALRFKLGVPAGTETRDSSPIRWLSVDEWGAIAVVATWSFCSLGLIRLLRPTTRAPMRLPFIVAGSIALLTLSLAIVAWSDYSSRPNAIVLQADTILRQSPLEEARPAFTAPSGAELRVRDSRPGWIMGEDPGSGRFGWVPRQQLGLVVP